ncbi:UNVERIFIED_CONTAM: hypothetical protein Sradi_6872500 [Sesamum radiatum]|uniref:Btz domain-containing protein n=1 Tax=Sesamum radiatum TaxID=300843 RepID=A0AAW2JL74_SESRA
MMWRWWQWKELRMRKKELFTVELLEEEEKKEVNDEANKIDDENNNVPDGQHEEERKEMEPFAVPTAGAFYMHDDRFRDNAGGRHRYQLMLCVRMSCIDWILYG